MSRSVGDMDLDDEFARLDSEGRSRAKKKKSGSILKLFSGSSRSRSRDQLEQLSSSSESDDTLADDFHFKKGQQRPRQRSNEFSIAEVEVHQNQSVNDRHRSASESTAAASFNLHQSKRPVFADMKTKSQDTDDRKFGMLRQNSHETNDKNRRTHDHHQRNEAPPMGDSRGKPPSFMSVPHHQQSFSKKDILDSSEFSDEGTDLDDQPWSRPIDAPFSHTAPPSHAGMEPNMSPMHQKPHYPEKMMEEYMNVNERTPMFQNTPPPIPPPKNFTGPPLPPKSIGLQNSSDSGPPLPPKNVFSTPPKTSALQIGPNNIGSTHGQAMNQCSCGMQNFPTGKAYNQSGHACSHNFCSGPAMPQNYPLQGWSNQHNTSFDCNSWHSQQPSFSGDNFRPACSGNCGQAQIAASQWQSQPLKEFNRNPTIENHQMQAMAQSPHRHREPQTSVLQQSHRQFKSTANLRSDGNNTDDIRTNSNRMHKSKSTDILSVQGLVHEDSDAENLAPSKSPSKMKKTKSKIVLDDLSLASEEAMPMVKKNKPKLSEEKKRGRLEMWSGLLQLLTICACLLTTVPMAIMTRNWDWFAHKCPLFVESNLQHDRFWGNPSMIPCYMTAYLPVVVMAIALILIFVHGGLLFFWRSNRKSSSFYTKKAFAVTLMFCNFLAFGISFTVACTLTDGLRQTCLSFEFISDIDYRPTNCQNGFNGLDLNYDIEGTMYYIIFAIIGAWLSVIFTLISFVLYFKRVKVCSCNTH